MSLSAALGPQVPGSYGAGLGERVFSKVNKGAKTFHDSMLNRPSTKSS